ncbi:double-strand break repair protein AddB [uncultured Jannaschia sp.]|uniref:double-strand break repair protein AddB n=1 Tax=uncultured Jannaschia sp. TaxID=293347 RepID=UPI002617CE53|nr:double-strand break repair protein AddB [uncultured Jannaschia sp.]
MHGLYYEPLGVDFSVALARGLRARMADAPPEALARVTVLVNTSRMARRLEAALMADGATLLPRIGLVTDFAPLLPPGDMPVASVSKLAIRLRLTQLVESLLRVRPDLSPRAAAFDLACGLETLLSEMQEEEMLPDALDCMETGDLSEHWQRNLEFLRIATDWLEHIGELTPVGAQIRALDRLCARWTATPPTDPVIVAGSTASRAPTRRLIREVLALPQGVVVLPGLDSDMPHDAWADLTPGAAHHDHPQYRHAALLEMLDVQRDAIRRWDDSVQPAVPARNALVSLALRPAPATDAWLAEGPELTDVAGACRDVTLLTAPSPGAEATAIACGLRDALAQDKRAALITPDRTLAREVRAQLERWDILPDESAGQPLNQSAPGRLLLHLAGMRGRPVEAEGLAILLNHPLTQIGGDRAEHLRQARLLEVALLRRDPLPFPNRDAIEVWCEDPSTPETDEAWSHWLCGLVDNLLSQPRMAPLAEHARSHLVLVERAARGTGSSADAVWEGPAGQAALRVIEQIQAGAGERGGEPVPAQEFNRILQTMLSGEEVRDTYGTSDRIMIWGALEARVRHADLVILGGLNEDVWPAQPSPDPWLNRAMRRSCGLRPPERTVGLSAHDFQQAAAAPEIWLSRAARTAETETVPSRWLNRIVGLLGGIGAAGETALAGMRARGAHWLRVAALLDEPAGLPTGPAPRPAPKLPAGVRLDRISVTAVETLIRDPYHIYARDILRLRPLAPLRQGPDAALRGSAVHDAMERFTRRLSGRDLPPDAADLLRRAFETTLEETAPWPGMRRMWLGKFDRVIPDFLAAETTRRGLGTPLLVEGQGRRRFEGAGFTLTARADRIDLRDGAVAIYDYKTGTPPSPKQQNAYAKQLLLEAMMVADGAFEGVPDLPVEEAAYLRVGNTYGEVAPAALDAEAIDATRDQLVRLMQGYATGTPFIARLAPDLLTYDGDYDHLARYGEWDDTQPATVIPVGRP